MKSIAESGRLVGIYFSYVQTLTGLLVQVAVMVHGVDSYAAFFKAQTALVLVWAVCNLSLRDLDISKINNVEVLKDRSVMLFVFIVFTTAFLIYLMWLSSSNQFAIIFILIYGLKKSIDYVYETYSVRLTLRTFEIRNLFVNLLLTLSILDVIICVVLLIDVRYLRFSSWSYILFGYMLVSFLIIFLFYWEVSKARVRKCNGPKIFSSKRCFSILFPIWSLIPRTMLSIFSTDTVISSFGMAMLPTVLIPPVLSSIGQVKRVGHCVWLGFAVFLGYFAFLYFMLGEIYQLVGIQFVRSDMALFVVAALVSIRSLNQILNSGKILGNNISYGVKLRLMLISACLAASFTLIGGAHMILYFVIVAPVSYLALYMGIMLRNRSNKYQ